MGQYYKGIMLREDKTVIAWAEPWTFGNGAKLMEHSWIGNNFVSLFENLLFRNPTNFLWCGDYAEPDKDLGIDEEAVKDGYNGAMNFYDVCTYKGNTKKEITEGNTKTDKRIKYVINHTTKEFIDKRKVPLTDTYVASDGSKHDYFIHPLPLMTCKGNGQGGGDFFKEDPQGLIGKWAFNEISTDSRKPKGYKEILFDLKE